MNKNDDFFDNLYLKWYQCLLKYAYRLTLDKSLAEEIVQETFTEAYKKVELLQQHENVAGWLYVTTKNIARSYLRKAMKINASIHTEEFEPPVMYEDNISYYLADNLSKEESDIITRFYKDRQPVTEIAEDLSISISACKMRLKRARDKLKKSYEKNNLGM